MVTVELLSEGDTEALDTVVRIGKQSFPFPQSALLHESDHVFAARHDDEIVGGTIAEVFEPTRGRTVGLVTWIFTDAEARGLGAGKRLLERTVAHLEELGCDTVVAAVRWQNTSSSKLFASEGFARTSSSRLLGEYGLLGTARFYRDAMYLGPGWELWTKGFDGSDAGTVGEAAATDSQRVNGGEPAAADSSSGGLRIGARMAEAAVANALLFVVAAVSVLGVDAVAEVPLAVVAVPVGFLAVRHLPTALAAFADSDAWTFRTWENAYPPGLLLAALGLYVPGPGAISPAQRLWTLDEELPRLGPAAAISSALVVGLYGAFLVPGALPVPVPGSVADLVVRTMWVFLVVDILYITFPFNTYNGRIVYDWSRPAWAVLAAATGATLVMAAVDTGLLSTVSALLGL